MINLSHLLPSTSKYNPYGDASQQNNSSGNKNSVLVYNNSIDALDSISNLQNTSSSEANNLLRLKDALRIQAQGVEDNKYDLQEKFKYADLNIFAFQADKVKYTAELESLKSSTQVQTLISEGGSDIFQYKAPNVKPAISATTVDTASTTLGLAPIVAATDPTTVPTVSSTSTVIAQETTVQTQSSTNIVDALNNLFATKVLDPAEFDSALKILASISSTESLITYSEETAVKETVNKENYAALLSENEHAYQALESEGASLLAKIAKFDEPNPNLQKDNRLEILA